MLNESKVPAGSTRLKSRSVFLTASALIVACRISPRSLPKSMPGNCVATWKNVVSSGSSLGRMRTQK